MASKSARSVFDFLCLVGELAENFGRVWKFDTDRDRRALSQVAKFV
ncbi:hypothetical protein Q5692_27855 [Microcoleus sp. C2C3]